MSGITCCAIIANNVEAAGVGKSIGLPEIYLIGWIDQKHLLAASVTLVLFTKPLARSISCFCTKWLAATDNPGSDQIFIVLATPPKALIAQSKKLAIF